MAGLVQNSSAILQTFYNITEMINDTVLLITGEILTTATEFDGDKIIWDDDKK